MTINISSINFYQVLHIYEKANPKVRLPFITFFKEVFFLLCFIIKLLEKCTGKLNRILPKHFRN